MARIIAVHSFRGGTGKSNTVANVAAVLAARGRRVGVVDTDIQSPGIHVLFGQKGGSLTHTLNDYLWGRCTIAEAAHDVTPKASSTGQIFLIPSSANTQDISRILRESYDARDLVRGLSDLVRQLALDVVLIDTHPGINEETLLSMAISETLVVVLRPDAQDYEGTGITLQVARELDVPNLLLIANKVPGVLEPGALQARLEQAYACPVAAVLQHCDEMMLLGSDDLFVLRYPDHPMAHQYRQIASRLAPGT